MKARLFPRLLAALVLMVAVGVPSLYADPIAIRLSDGINTVTIVDGGAGDLSSAPGVVAFLGSIGSWNINVSTGVGSSILGPGRLDLHSVNTSSAGTGSSLTIMFSQYNMMQTFPSWELYFGGTSVNLASVTYQAWADDSNGLFGQTTSLGTVGPFTGSPYSGTVSSGNLNLTGPYSLTQGIKITGIAGMFNSFGGDAELRPLPEPTSFVLLGVALVGIGLLGRRGGLS